ncbi:MAG: DUF2309 domain-containing protein [bacterium]
MSNFRKELDEQITKAGEKIGRSWPLYSFVTSNPLSGLENKPFEEAVSQARGVFGGRGYPTASQFRQAWGTNRIDPDILEQKLNEAGIEQPIEELLQQLESHDSDRDHNRSLGSAERSLNQILEKWLSSFLDEGQSQWSMPNREDGFYRAWKKIASVDRHIPNAGELSDLPDNKYDAIEQVLQSVPPKDRNRVFTYHITALPGWCGYIKQRSQRSNDEWSEKYPIDLTDYLAVRLILADHLGATIVPDKEVLDPEDDELDPVRRSFLQAWEETYRCNLVNSLHLDTQEPPSSERENRPDAQMVFCIDTRSEIIRRHIESTGNYETHGYAGFFGVPMRFREYGKSTTINACPPIVEPEQTLHDDVKDDASGNGEAFKNWTELKQTAKKSFKNIKDNVASAFNYVEFSGLFYGVGMIGKTLFPSTTNSATKLSDSKLPDYDEVTEVNLDDSNPKSNGSPADGFSLSQKVTYAENAFKLMGWKHFAPIVVFVGHTSQTSNNPFDSSLQCGACSGNSGTPSARVLASICNQQAVREQLKERGFEIPEDTVFLAGRHNTTTDEITLLDKEVDDGYSDQLDQLRGDLNTAREKATAERMEQMPTIDVQNSQDETKLRASDWAQTRPEWGLAKNASFIVGPNRLRENVDLDGRAFLHTYDWTTDPDGSALESIFTGPVVVCQWINHQYYFSAIDNGLYGSGSKITHNPVGNFGVLQGNGGDLMTGLPLQSLMKTDTEFQHEPLRILTLVHAPLERVQTILDKHQSIKQLVQNDWIGLSVIDPTQDNELIRIGGTEESTTDCTTEASEQPAKTTS